MTSATVSHLITKRDAPDERDHRFEASHAAPPPTADLRANCPAIYNQLTLKSCSANAISAAMQLIANSTKSTLTAPSRLFLYYNARKRENDAAVDNGATIRNAIKAAAKPGACPETLWPYDPSNVCVEPPQPAYDGVIARAVTYARIERNLSDLKSCIAEGYPFVFGVQIYYSTALGAQTTGWLHQPAANDTLIGGHAILAVAYDDNAKDVVALNSLGPTFGDNGYLHIPYDYFGTDKLTYDFWTIREIG